MQKQESTITLIANKGKCSECFDLVQSWFQHDFKRCKCTRAYLDGGAQYIRYGGTMEVFPVYSDAPFEILRENFYRNGHGKDGRSAYQSCVLMNMSDEYLQVLLTYPVSEWQIDLIRKEIEFRKENNIIVTTSKVTYHE